MGCARGYSARAEILAVVIHRGDARDVK